MNNLFAFSWNFLGRKNNNALVTTRWNILWLFLNIVMFLFLLWGETLLRKMSHHFTILKVFSDEGNLVFEPQVWHPGSQWVTKKMRTFSCCVYWDALNSYPELTSFISHICSNCEFSLASLNTFHLFNDCVLPESQTHSSGILLL